MTLTDKQVEDFQLLYKKHFGNDIGFNEAYQKGMRLVQLMEIIMKKKINVNNKTKIYE